MFRPALLRNTYWRRIDQTGVARIAQDIAGKCLESRAGASRGVQPGRRQRRYAETVYGASSGDRRAGKHAVSA